MLPTTLGGSQDMGDSTPDEDQGVIRCICNFEDDDGFTIQCENCLVWQHAVCVNISQDNVPDEYLCERCNSRSLDVEKAVEYQKRRLENEHKRANETRKKQRYAPAKGKKVEGVNERRRRELAKSRAKSGKGAGGQESLSPTGMRTGDRLRDGTVALDSSYTHIDRNILGADVQVLFQSVLSQLAEQRNAVSTAAASVSSASTGLAVSAVSSATQDKDESESSANGITIQHNAENESAQEPQPPSSEAKTILPPMVPVTGNELSRQGPVYRGIADKDRGQIGLFTRENVRPGTFLCEYRGQVVLKAAYKEDPKNYYELLRTTRPYSQFHQEIDLCVDARRQGSEARFVRRSCQPNSVLKSMYVTGSDDALIHLGLFSKRDIQADEELTVGWEWDDGELPAVASMSPSDAEDYLGRPEGRRMSKVWRQVFGGIVCACLDPSCDVRRLFAMLGVEESAAVDMSNSLKRRTSRANRVGIGASDNAEADADMPVSPAVRSSDDAAPQRSTHSRKSSTNGPQGALGLGPAAQNSSDTTGHRDSLSVSSSRQLAPGTSRQSSAESVGTQSRRVSGGSSQHRSANGKARSRKRKSSPHSNGVGNGKHAALAASESESDSMGTKKSRSSSQLDLPQKKLWISRYLKHAQQKSADSSVPAAPVAADTVSLATASASEDLKQNSESKEEQATTNAAPASSRPAVKAVESSRVVKSEPTDADAPTPSPSSSPSLAGGMTIVESADGPGVPASSSTPSPKTKPSRPPPVPEQPLPETNSETQATPSVETKPGTEDTSPAKAAAPAKKQRLSLAEYNKRRRGHTAAAPTAKEEPKTPKPSTPDPADSASAEPLAPGNSTKPAAAAALPMNGMPPAPAGLKTPELLTKRSIAPPPPPPPPPPPLPPPPLHALPRSPGPAYLGTREERASTNGSRDHHRHRIERGADERGTAAYSPMYRGHERGVHDAHAEREAGEYPHRRGYRVRSQSRERGPGGRERRHHTYGGHHGHQTAPARNAEWRPGIGGMRAMSMSPGPGSGGASAGPQSGTGGESSFHRGTVRHGSRGGSPAQR